MLLPMPLPFARESSSPTRDWCRAGRSLQPKQQHQRSNIQRSTEFKRHQVAVGRVVNIAGDKRAERRRRTSNGKDESDDGADFRPPKKVTDQRGKQSGDSSVRKSE